MSLFVLFNFDMFHISFSLTFFTSQSVLKHRKLKKISSSMFCVTASLVYLDLLLGAAHTQKLVQKRQF